MHPPTTIRTDDIRELLALIPFQLGFEPARSVVLVSLRGSRSRVGLVARVDLDALSDPVDGPQMARSLVTHLVNDGASKAVVVIYTDRDGQAREPASQERRARAHLQVAFEYFLGRPACWVVGPWGFYELDCDDPRCCPAGGRSLADLQSTAVGAQMVFSGASVARSRDELVRIPAAPTLARRSARRAAHRWAARRPDGLEIGPGHHWRRESLHLWRAEITRGLVERAGAGDPGRVEEGGEQVAVWTPPTPTVLGRLQAALDDVLVRDAVLLALVPGAEGIGDRVIVGDAGKEVGRALGAIVDPEHGTPPSAPTCVAAGAVLEQVVAHSPRRHQAPALTLLAVLAWWAGDGARASLCVERAIAADPSHRLAALMSDTLSTGMPPGWLRSTGT